jgi:hypothetical protein
VFSNSEMSLVSAVHAGFRLFRDLLADGHFDSLVQVLPHFNGDSMGSVSGRNRCTLPRQKYRHGAWPGRLA